MGIYLGTLPTGDRLVELARAQAYLTPRERATDLRTARICAGMWAKLLGSDTRGLPRVLPGVGAYGHPRPAVGRSWFRVGATLGGRAQVHIFDEIGEFGVTAGDFAARLDAVTAPAIDLHVDSPGGLALDGFGVYQVIRDHPARVTAHVDGLAGSAASYVVQAADEILIGSSARMMIHDAHGLMVYGGAADVRNEAELLNELSDICARLYARRAGGSAASWRAQMSANHGEGTWYTAAEAVAAGLADRIEGDGTGGWVAWRPGAMLAGPARTRHAVSVRR